ncbi:MAG: META domain-containing protein [Steroidobacteraceae bacterium]
MKTTMLAVAAALLVIAPRAPSGAREAGPVTLTGTAWILEDLAGAGVVDRVQATLEFPAEGRVSGNGSCNHFSGDVTLDGERIAFGTIAATQRSCPEAVMNQESAYLKALGKAERFETDGENLYVYIAENPEPLRFTRLGHEEQ